MTSSESITWVPEIESIALFVGEKPSVHAFKIAGEKLVVLVRDDFQGDRDAVAFAEASLRCRERFGHGRLVKNDDGTYAWVKEPDNEPQPTNP